MSFEKTATTMFRAYSSQMTMILPLFPLNLVVFPGEKLNLHIFEPRYRELINDCHSKGITFGIPPFIAETLKDVGTEVRLISIEKTYEDGRMDVKTEGVGLFDIKRMHRTIEGKLYSGAEVERRDYTEGDGDIMNKKLIYERVLDLFKFMNINKSIPENYSLIQTFQIAQHVGYNIEQKFEMLQIASEMDRQEFMLAHLNNLIPVVKEMESLRRRIQMNGHFKNIDPPQF